MAQAKERFVHDWRANVLSEQVAAWQKADALRRYCEALDAAYGEHAETAAWLAWIKEFVLQTDPPARPPTMPSVPEPGPEDLQQYLPAGWSARGPSAYR